MRTIAIINGPNLNLLGTRETDIYGAETWPLVQERLTAQFPDMALLFYQSNVEGELIDYLHACRGQAQGVVLNAGGYTHTSIALADAVAATGLPVIEVHISNVLAREDYRRTSYIASRCIGSISGLGTNGYALALAHFRTTGASLK